MHEESLGGQTSHNREVALTPRPVRLLIVGRVKPGAETKLRETQARFPHDAAIEAGIDAVEAFVGSGYYAVELEIDRDDVQHVLATFFNHPRVRSFRASLASIVEGLPEAGYQFGPGDGFHEADAAAGEQPGSTPTVYNTGDLPIAASMYRWRVGQPPQTGRVPHGKTGA